MTAEHTQVPQHVGIYRIPQFEKGSSQALAGGDRASHLNAKKRLMDNANDGRIQDGYATPREPDALLYEALLPGAQCEGVAEYDAHQWAFAATATVANLVKTAGFDAPALYRNIDSFAPAVSGWEMGFRDPRLMEMISWFAAAAAANGVTSDADSQLAHRRGWFIEKNATDQGVKREAAAAAFRDSSLQVAPTG